MKNKTNFLRLCCFLMLFVLILGATDRILVGKTYPIRTNLNVKISPYVLAQKLDGFYALDRNTIDVVFLGSSHIHCGINPLIIWEKYGYTSYDLSADSQDMATAYYYCQEMFKTQSPQKVVVTIDVIPERQIDIAAHFSFDFMRPSLTKLKGVIRRAPSGNALSFLTAFPDYHTRWQELTEDDFKYLTSSKEHIFNGYFAYCVETPLVPPENQNIITSSGLDDIQKKYIDKLYDLCQSHNCELEFIKTPSAIANSYTDLVNSVRDYVKNRDVLVTDYSFDNRIGIDWNRDFADEIHANIYGAEKFSIVLGGDILKDMKIAEKNDTITEKYNRNLKTYRRYVQNYELTKIQEENELILQLEQDSRYVVFEVGRGDPAVPLSYKNYRSGEGNVWTYIKVFSGEDVVTEQQSVQNLEYTYSVDGKDIELKSCVNPNMDTSIRFDYEKELSNNQRGLNIVIYDTETHEIVDIRTIDIYALQGA